ncbi:MAG: hypothetical protein ACRCYC_10375 [Paraclostridium sp.]|uniref:hypothetical protein n=1 Tax=Paraclostridium sp. TaxID=2023273 RepID=UPI003F40245D
MMFERNLTEFIGLTNTKLTNLKYFSEINLQKIYNLENLNTQIVQINKISIDYIIKDTKIIYLDLHPLLLIDIEFALSIQYISLDNKVKNLNLILPHVSYVNIQKKILKNSTNKPQVLINNIHYHLTEKILLIHIYGICVYM